MPVHSAIIWVCFLAVQRMHAHLKFLLYSSSYNHMACGANSIGEQNRFARPSTPGLSTLDDLNRMFAHHIHIDRDLSERCHPQHLVAGPRAYSLQA